ncbi:hypothetical protein JTB14_009174 [Gonioctena quinquepunctata]|nr:hypothetical protein JTB14_009174 [Gonioctena quinquepunctata]
MQFCGERNPCSKQDGRSVDEDENYPEMNQDARFTVSDFEEPGERYLRNPEAKGNPSGQYRKFHLEKAHSPKFIKNQNYPISEHVAQGIKLRFSELMIWKIMYNITRMRQIFTGLKWLPGARKFRITKLR